jgi:hypothetical protein
MSENHPQHEHQHEVRIHINREPFHSPTPTTGEALYKLGHIEEGFELFREVRGDEEDQRVPKGHQEVHLKEDEHFYSEKIKPKNITIIVNGTPHEWRLPEISYAQVVTLDVPDYPQHPEITYSVKYKNGPSHKPEGTLSLGGTVKVKDGEAFTVSPTGQS